MSPTFSTVVVGQGDSQKIEEPEVSAKWCLHWQTRSAFLPHGRQRPPPRVTKAQQKCHTAPENGTVDLAFSITIFLTEICRLSMESNFFFFVVGGILRCSICRAARQLQWWKTLGVSLGVGGLELFALHCHYLAFLYSSNVSAVE